MFSDSVNSYRKAYNFLWGFCLFLFFKSSTECKFYDFAEMFQLMVSHREDSSNFII